LNPLEFTIVTGRKVMDALTLLFSFCGGVIGAVFGPVTTFVAAGCVGLLGIIAAISGVKFDWIGVVSLGPVFGPHIAFVGGVGAAAFAGRKGYLETGKDIIKPLISLKKPTVLIVGGVFGLLGYMLNSLVTYLFPGKIDSIGLTIVTLGIVGKVIFGKEGVKGIIGSVPEETKAAGGRYSVNSKGVWLPWMNAALEKTMVGIAAGGGSAYITYVMLQNPETSKVAGFVGFFLSAASLIWLECGHSIAVTHHITLCASYAVVASGGSIIWGFAGALIAAFSADFLAKTFFVYGSDAHVDPPSMGIAFTSLFLLGIFPALRLYDFGNLAPMAIFMLVLIYIAAEHIAGKRKTA
jgi:hypothetical protein